MGALLILQLLDGMNGFGRPHINTFLTLLAKIDA